MKLIFLFAALMPLMSAPGSIAGPADSNDGDTASYELTHRVIVVGNRMSRSSVDFPFEKDRFAQVLQSNGFGLISKGVYLAQDIYADGFKRDDITIVIDGERYHSACPNRMDSPLARTNPLEMQSISLERTSADLQSGLGGAVSYHREPLVVPTSIRAGYGQSIGRYSASDLAFTVTGGNHRLAGQYATGEGYDDGDGRSFVDRYGYRDNSRYLLADVALSGRYDKWQYRGELTYTEDVMFPYLMMDERTNRVFSGSLAYGDHKLYTNYTDHLMDNGLRRDMMSMLTDATNLTVGAAGRHYDIFYRRWDADNRIVTPLMSIANHLMPDVRQVSAAGTYDGHLRQLSWWLRAGLSRFTFDETSVDFFAGLYGDVDTDRWFANLAVGSSWPVLTGAAVQGKLVVDVITEPPPAQSMFISVRRPMGKPWWSGNPGLDAPIRATVRSELRGYGVTADLAASYVWNYVNLASGVSTESSQMYQTYENIDALLLTVGLTGSWRHLDVNAGYTRAGIEPGGGALSEVPPLYLTYVLKSPEYQRTTVWLRHEYNDAQTRVDGALLETPSDAWHRFDLGLNCSLESVRFGLEFVNLFDELYARHMSYARNPYSAGMTVYEPGRTVRLNLMFNVD